MRRTLLALAALTTLVAAQLQAQPVPVDIAALPDTKRLAPSSPWNLDFAENKCRLQRVFENEGKPHALIIEQSAPQATFSLVVAGPTLARLKGTKDLAIGLAGDLPLETGRRILPGTLPDYGSAFVLTSFSLSQPGAMAAGDGNGLRSAGIDLDQASKVNRIVLGNPKGKPAVSFETGNMRDAFAALNTCTADLLAQWGLNAEQHRAYRQPRIVNEIELARYLQQTYPQGALAKKESGLFVFRLIVEADGTVSGCHIEASSAVTELDPRCETIIRIARMEPARDAQGQPMRSFYVTSLTYQIG